MSDLVVLKIGGSVITKKSEPFTLNLSSIERLAEEIFQAKPPNLILVHGGGSFGHPVAKEYRIAEGYKDSIQLYGFVKTHEAMISLNIKIVENLLKMKLPAFGMAPSSFITTKNGRIFTFEDTPLKQALKLGLIPVLYGDAVLDINKGFAILSGDQLASFMAGRIKAQRLIMGVDVDGIFTEDPKKNPSAHLIPRLALSELKDLKNKITGAEVADVTGGMMGKVSEIVSLISKGIETLIVNASKPGIIYKALKGDEVVGTKIEP